MKSFLSKLLAASILFLPALVGTPAALAAGTAYVPLEPDFIGVKGNASINFIQYANYAFKVVLTIAIVLAVIQIIIGGLAYMTSSVVSVKADGKSKVTGALYGLGIALLSYLILYTINPKLVNWDDNLTQLGGSANQQSR